MVEVFTILADDATRSVFDAVANARIITLKDLSEFVADGNTEVVKERLQRLEQAKLVEVKHGPVEDFSRVYVTGDGLALQRRLKRTAVE